LPQGQVWLSRKGFRIGAGVVDRDYRGEIGVLIFNLSNQELKIGRGDRVAQLIIEMALEGKVEETQELDQTQRGSQGFGSTGRKPIEGKISFASCHVTVYIDPASPSPDLSQSSAHLGLEPIGDNLRAMAEPPPLGGGVGAQCAGDVDWFTLDAPADSPPTLGPEEVEEEWQVKGGGKRTKGKKGGKGGHSQASTKPKGKGKEKASSSSSSKPAGRAKAGRKGSFAPTSPASALQGLSNRGNPRWSNDDPEDLVGAGEEDLPKPEEQEDVETTGCPVLDYGEVTREAKEEELPMLQCIPCAGRVAFLCDPRSCE